MIESAERELIASARRHKARRQSLDEAERERDEAIRRAIAAEVPRRRIKDVTGLSLQRIDQIRRGSRL